MTGREDGLLTTFDVALRLGVPAQTVRRAVGTGDIVPEVLGARKVLHLFTVEEVDRWAAVLARRAVPRSYNLIPRRGSR